jgi:hypothetical protein
MFNNNYNSNCEFGYRYYRCEVDKHLADNGKNIAVQGKDIAVEG